MFRRQSYYIASAAFVIISLLYFFAVSKQAYIGLELMNVNGQWVVTACDSGGQAYRLGIRMGDVIVKIDNHETAEYRLVQKWNEAEGASLIEYYSQGHPENTVIEIAERTSFVKLLSEIPMVALGYVFWILGLVAWVKRPFMVQTHILFWLNLFIGLAIVIAPASSRDLLLAREAEYITLAFMSILLVHLFSIFPNTNKSRLIKYGTLTLYALVTLVTILTILKSACINQEISFLRSLVLATAILGILLSVWSLGISARSANVKTKNQAIILLLGMGLGFCPFIFLTAIPVMLKLPPVVNTTTSYLFVAFIPVTWYYTIIHPYLLDSRKHLSKIISFVLAAVIISTIVVTLMSFFLAQGLKPLTLEPYMAMLSLNMLFLLVFILIRAVITRSLRRFGISEEDQLLNKKIVEINEKLVSIEEETPVLEELMAVLEVDGVLVIVENSNVGYFKKVTGRLAQKPDEQAQLEKFFKLANSSTGRVDKSFQAKVLPNDLSASIYLSCIINDVNCGIFLGHRYSRIKFEENELTLITLILSQVAHHIVKTLAITELSKEVEKISRQLLSVQRRSRSLQGLAGFLFKDIEKKGKSLAEDIHAGPLQLALDLNRRLKGIADHCLMAVDGKVAQTVAHMRETAEELIYELRSICNDLRPPTLSELGLLSAIELMCKDIMFKELVLISLETEGIGKDDRSKEEVEIAAYRFVQEGIANAIKHSGSKEVKVHLRLGQSGMELKVCDSGRGFDAAQIDDWSLNNGHLGLVGIKERIESLGGVLEISSAIGEGTVLNASIPIESLTGE